MNLFCPISSIRRIHSFSTPSLVPQPITISTLFFLHPLESRSQTTSPSSIVRPYGGVKPNFAHRKGSGTLDSRLCYLILRALLLSCVSLVKIANRVNDDGPQRFWLSNAAQSRLPCPFAGHSTTVPLLSESDAVVSPVKCPLTALFRCCTTATRRSYDAPGIPTAIARYVCIVIFFFSWPLDSDSDRCPRSLPGGGSARH